MVTHWCAWCNYYRLFIQDTVRVQEQPKRSRMKDMTVFLFTWRLYYKRWKTRSIHENKRVWYTSSNSNERILSHCMNGAHHKLASNVDIDQVLIETSLFITVSECIYPWPFSLYIWKVWAFILSCLKHTLDNNKNASGNINKVWCLFDFYPCIYTDFSCVFFVWMKWFVCALRCWGLFTMKLKVLNMTQNSKFKYKINRWNWKIINRRIRGNALYPLPSVWRMRFIVNAWELSKG